MPDRELLKLQEEIESWKAEPAALKRDCALGPRGVLRRLLADPRVRIALAAAVVAIPLAAYAAQISVPNTFVNGTIADAAEVNANFGVLVTESNAQDSRIATVETDTANHAANPSAHHAKYTDPEAVAAILAADGSGSGLDADLLDGQQATAFASVGHGHDHGSLSGLEDDDHTQYFNLSQSETVTGRPARWAGSRCRGRGWGRCATRRPCRR